MKQSATCQYAKTLGNEIMKRILYCKIFLLILVCTLAWTTAQASAAPAKTAAGTETKTKKRSGWYTVNGKTYYFSKKTGALFPSKTIKRKLSKLEKLCKQIVDKKVKKSDSNNTKLKKLFKYVAWNCNYKRRTDFSGKKGWYRKYAYDMLTTKKGNCYCFAAAFACLAKRATNLPVRVGWGYTPQRSGGLAPHGWCEIKINGTWYVFDPDFYRYVDNGNFYRKKMKQVKKYYRKRHYAIVEFKNT